jgi:hypothetical protein
MYCYVQALGVGAASRKTGFLMCKAACIIGWPNFYNSTRKVSNLETSCDSPENQNVPRNLEGGVLVPAPLFSLHSYPRHRESRDDAHAGLFIRHVSFHPQKASAAE